MGNNRRRPRHLEMGVVLLGMELLKIGWDVIPPVTLFSIVGQALLYVGVIDVPWDKWDVCISGEKVWMKRDYKTLILSVIEHANDEHLYYNMISFLLKGRSLEPKYGSANFALLLGIISLMTSSLYVALAVMLSHLLSDASYLQSCAIGFSGVIFALKIITTVNSGGYSEVMGMRVHTKYAAWAELIAIHVLVPNASFLGHLAGIIAGLLYMKTPLKRVINNFITGATGVRITENRYGTEYNYSGYRYR